MNDKLFEEDLSISYLRAIAAQAKVTFQLNNRDEDGKDVDLKQIVETNEGLKFNAEICVQLKATCSKNCYSENDSEITYSLKAKNYNDLCMKGTNSIILCLLILPEDCKDWVKQSPDDLILKKSMYWFSPTDKTPTNNSESVTIKIPKTQLFTAEVLKGMMQSVANNGGIL